MSSFDLASLGDALKDTTQPKTGSILIPNELYLNGTFEYTDTMPYYFNSNPLHFENQYLKRGIMRMRVESDLFLYMTGDFDSNGYAIRLLSSGSFKGVVESSLAPKKGTLRIDNEDQVSIFCYGEWSGLKLNGVIQYSTPKGEYVFNGSFLIETFTRGSILLPSGEQYEGEMFVECQSAIFKGRRIIGNDAEFLICPMQFVESIRQYIPNP